MTTDGPVAPTHFDGGNFEQRVPILEKEAEKFAAYSDSILIGMIGTVSGNIVRETAQAELARRVKEELVKSSAAASGQTQEVIRLTAMLLWLTAALTLIGVVQAADIIGRWLS
jgi:hypothetical protein